MPFLKLFRILLFLVGSLIGCQTFAQNENYSIELAYLRNSGLKPADYLVSKFLTNDVVLLGEDHAIREDLDFVRELIPRLYSAQVYNLGMEFGAYEMQNRLDSLLSAEKYSEQTARDIMYFYNVGWAYKEYTDIYYAAWQFNRSLPAGARKFRILNISYQFHWDGFRPPRTPENMKKVFPKGTPDDFRARIIDKEILKKGEKILLFVGSPHAFTKYRKPVLNMDNNDFCDYDDGWLGNRLIKMYPGKIISILLHSAFYSKPGQKPYQVSPANGALETILNAHNNVPVGFDLAGSPLGNLPDSSSYSMCYPDFRLGQLFDGYIFLKAYQELHGCTLDTLYFRNKEWTEIERDMPDKDWRGDIRNLEEYRNSIETYVNMKSRYRELIDNRIPKPSSGMIRRFPNFPSDNVQPRNVDVWLPANYDPARKYSVLYMNDGQMLFDSSTTWNHQEWQVDEHMTSLMMAHKIRECIVVGIWNTEFRHSEYFPEKALDFHLAGPAKGTLIIKTLKGKARSDNYLKFITSELKPFIDKTFSTKTDMSNTFIAGSSMGGLISMYALCEYPEIFGGAACLSTHWVGDFNTLNVTIANAFQEYLQFHLPSPWNHKIYFDYGTATLDSFYKQHQIKVDKIMKAKGYTSATWKTREFPGADHSEKSWSNRLEIPLSFILK